jgi:hypothetical protein
MIKMMPNPATMKELYNRIHSGGKKVKKQILVDALKLPHYWSDYCKKRAEQYIRDVDIFEYKLATGQLED